MTKLLVEKKRVISVKAESIQGDYRYDVNYELADKSLGRLSCNVYSKESGEYTGYMNLENENSNFNFPESADAITHIGVFQKITAEIKATLV